MDLERFPPDWFSLEKYKNITQKMGLREWGEALEGRSLLWMALKPGSGWFEEDGIKKIDAHLEIFSRLIKLDFGKNRFSDKSITAEQSVSSVTLEDLAFNWNYYSEMEDIYPIRDILLSGYYNEEQEELEVIKKYHELRSKKIDLINYEPDSKQADISVGKVLVSVDIDSSDDQLIDDFKKWLQSSREILCVEGTRKRFNKSHFARWHKNMVLPYIDLMLYTKLSGRPQTLGVLGKTLYPDEYDIGVEDMIRRTVRPLAEEVVSPEISRALLRQLSNEAA